MSTLALSSIPLVLALAVYAAGLYLGALAFVWGRLKPRRERATPKALRAVSVLVPARGEGMMAVRAVRSLLEQDTPAPVHIHVLLGDARDSSLAHLRDAFAEGSASEAGPRLTLLRDATRFSGPRSLTVLLSGVDGKAEKLNHAILGLETPLTAVLDCDHQARPDWLRSAAACLEDDGVRVVQSRRYGLRAEGLFSLWDSLHQHVGCEVFNVAFRVTGLTVFLTGTTFVAETELLRSHPFRACLTEDVDLSYALLMEGVRATADPTTGSDEELSPNLSSFLARRRRWAKGHTAAFWRHLPRLAGAPLRFRDRAQFLFHGVHYLVAPLVLILHLMIGVHFGLALGPEVFGGAIAAGALAAVGIGRAQAAASFGQRLVETTALTLWLAPLAMILVNLALALLLDDPNRAALPLRGWLSGVALAAFLAPLVVLFIGLALFGLLTPSVAIAVVFTFPIAFYLDLTGVLLGLTDAVTGEGRWRRVSRGGPIDHASMAELSPAVSLMESWGPRAFTARFMRSLPMALPRRLVSRQTFAWLTVFALLGAGFTVSRATRVPLAPAACRPLLHDGDPWIVPPDRIAGYCEREPAAEGNQWSRRASRFETTFVDDLAAPSRSRWEHLTTTFECNLSRFAPENVRAGSGGGTELVLREAESGDREFTAGSIATHAGDDSEHLFGRFEAEMKAARGSGLISAFFLHRRDPWQEIDVELLGRDTTQVIFNVYFNPGEDGATYNYGYSGTPVLVDLGFDAADDFHRYAIEWDVDEIRFFVDDRLVHRRRAGRPTPIPHLPMRLHLNLWATCAEDLAGPVDRSALPAVAAFREVSVGSRTPIALLPVWRFFDELVGEGPTGQASEPAAWQDEAEWLSRYSPR